MLGNVGSFHSIDLVPQIFELVYPLHVCMKLYDCQQVVSLVPPSIESARLLRAIILSPMA